MKISMTRRTTSFGVMGAILVAIAIGLAANSSLAWERYNQGCDDCHGGFFGGTSPKGTVFPENDKHEMHRGSAYMDADCSLCHGGDGEMYLASSGGTSSNPGVGCVGCHGRPYDGIGDSGVGLRKHHVASGISSCLGCHPSDPDPLPESVLPTYYGTTDTNADDPCNSGPDFLENWSLGDTIGLDNDGDLAYDGDDGDCGLCPEDITGDGVVDLLDLLATLAAWGTADPAADINGDGIVDVLDLLAVLGAWGPC